MELRKADRYIALRNLEKMCKAEAEALKPDVEDEMRAAFECDHTKSRAGIINGCDIGTLSVRVSKPAEAVTRQDLRVTDFSEFGEWAEANAPAIVRAVIEQPEVANLVAGYILITCGEVPAGCEFVEYVEKPAVKGGRFIGIQCTTKPAELLKALPQFAGVLTDAS